MPRTAKAKPTSSAAATASLPVRDLRLPTPLLHPRRAGSSRGYGNRHHRATATVNADGKTPAPGRDWSGGAITQRRRKNITLRARLQRKGTKSAKRLLRDRSRKEARFVADVNHQISKSIVAEAERTGRGIAVENLTGIRDRVRHRKPQRATMNSWAFAQLGQFLTYKAARAGVTFTQVDPRHTSQMCHACEGISKKNRRTQAEFVCVSCGVS